MPPDETQDGTSQANGSSGLAWPEEYRDLLPIIREQWQVDGEIYLLRSLSGKSGAHVFAADLTSHDFAGQAILKLDKAPDPQWGELSEAERHETAFKQTPEYAKEHLPVLVHTLVANGQLAILSTIAGRGLEYAVPWSHCPYDLQLTAVRKFSSDILEIWNKDYRMAPGMIMPDQILRDWLGYRVDPTEGRIYRFLSECCGITGYEPSITFEGHWYPNPLAFANPDSPLPERLQQRAAVGCSHGDLHAYNVLVSTRHKSDPTYYLIDLALFQDNHVLFYDHAYFEMHYLLFGRDSVNAGNLIAILNHMRRFHDTNAPTGLMSDTMGLINLVNALRQEAFDWIDRHENNRLSYMESQVLLARVAAGLNYANKPIADQHRHLAFLYAAYSLKAYLKLNNVDWPKYGPTLDLVPEGAPAAVTTPPPAAVTAPPPAAPSPVPAGRRSPAKPAQEPVPNAPTPPPAARKDNEQVVVSEESQPSKLKPIVVGLAVLLLILVGVVIWKPWTPESTGSATPEPVIPAPHKLSIAVIPFENLSSGAESQMLASGMTSAITVALTQVPELFVTSRRPTPDAQQDGDSGSEAQLQPVNTDYSLTGRLQVRDERVRVTVNLTDNKTSEHIWSNRYDRDVDDYFALQDEIALRVLVALQVKLTEGFQAAIRGQSTNNVEAYLLYLQAQENYRRFDAEAMDEVRRLSDEIMALDPQFRQALVLKAWSYIADARFGHGGSPEQSLETAAELLQEAADLDGKMSPGERAEVLIADAFIAQQKGDIQQALEIGKEAVQLGPNNADLLANYARILYFAGDHKQSRDLLLRAMQLRQTYPSWYAIYLSRNDAFLGRLSDAVKWARTGVARAESNLIKSRSLLNLAFVYEEAGESAKAKRAADEFRSLRPAFTLESYRKLQSYHDEDDWKRFAGALHKAGIP